MHPRIGKRSGYNKTEEKPKSNSVIFIELNTKKNITIRQEYLYLEDVKAALNIHHLETSILLKRWLIRQLSQIPDREKIIDGLEHSVDKDRHRLQKVYKISI